MNFLLIRGKFLKKLSKGISLKISQHAHMACERFAETAQKIGSKNLKFDLWPHNIWLQLLPHTPRLTHGGMRSRW